VGKKLYKKAIKKGIKDQGYNTWIASFHSLISNASSLVIHQSSKYLFTDFSYVKFSRHLPLLLPAHLIIPLQIGGSTGLHWIYTNHLKRCCTRFFSTGATSSLSRMSSFRTRSLLVWPQIHRSMRISAMLNYWTCRILVDQHSTTYNMISRIAVL
jgi:hypothetical protein